MGFRGAAPLHIPYVQCATPQVFTPANHTEHRRQHRQLGILPHYEARRGDVAAASLAARGASLQAALATPPSTRQRMPWKVAPRLHLEQRLGAARRAVRELERQMAALDAPAKGERRTK